MAQKKNGVSGVHGVCTEAETALSFSPNFSTADNVWAPCGLWSGSATTALCKHREPATSKGALATPRLPYQLPLCAMPRFFDLLPASLMLQPPQGQGLREAGTDRECPAGVWRAPLAATSSRAQPTCMKVWV